jgi:hypothetical protein
MEIATKVYQMKKEGKLLFEIEEGKEFLLKLMKMIEDLPKPGVLCLDFSDMNMGLSFCNQSISKFVGMLKGNTFDGRFLILTNLRAPTEEEISSSLRLAGRCVLVKVSAKDWKVIGEVKEHTLDVFRIVMEKKETTTREIMEKLKLEVNTASNKLALLCEERLIAKEKKPESYQGGGRQYMYYALF